MTGTLGKAFSLIDGDRRRRFAIIGVFAVIVSGLEAISAVLILVLMRLVLEPGDLPPLPLLGDVEDLFGGISYEEAVVGFAVTFGVFYAFRSIAFLAQSYAVARVAENTGALLAKRLVAGYLSMPYSFHLRRNSAELIRNAYDNVQQVQNAVFAQFGAVLAEIVMVLVLLAVLLIASPMATFVVVVLMVIAFSLVMVVVQPRLKRLGRERNAAAKSAIQHMQQGLGGVRDVKILGREREFAESFTRARLRMARPQYLRSTLLSVPRIVIEASFLGFILIVLVVAVIRDQATEILATLGLFAYAGLRLQPSVQSIARALNSIRFAEAAVDDLGADLRMLGDWGPRETSAVRRSPFAASIAFDDVSFSYGDEVQALSNVTCTLSAGQSIGISGASGGGKTTFVDILCGLLDPTHGRLLVDGRDVAGRIRAWQQNIGAVHQSSFLIDDTLRGNIAFGVPDGEVDDARVKEAVRLAELDEVVAHLPEGLATYVGERGVRLSGGQRQRVTIARAVYRNPGLLVLDEGTSALDNATEAKVIDNLQELRGNTTLVMIAHRLSTIRNCDRILYFEGGRIAADGTYDELLSSCDGFRSLVTGASR